MALKQINHEQYWKLLDLTMLTGEPLLIVGKPGIGKTRTPKMFCLERAINLIISHPAVDAPQDIKGYPAKSRMRVERKIELEDLLMGLDGESPEPEDEEWIDIATFLPFGQMLQILTATEPTIWFFDDFGQAPDSVQKALMQLIGDRELCGRKLPDCVKIIAATNGKEHKSGVVGLLEAVKSRFAIIVELMEDLPGWRVWANENNIYPTIPLFLEMQAGALSDFRTDKGMEQSPNPRLWEKLSKNLYGFDQLWGQPKEDDKELNEMRTIVCAGNLGSEWGEQYAAFERIRHKLPPYADIINDPEDYPINQALDVKYGMLGMLANSGKAIHHKQIFQFIGKMAKTYQVVFFRLVRQHNKALAETDSAQRWWAANMDLYID
jgi:hypothetical protein